MVIEGESSVENLCTYNQMSIDGTYHLTIDIDGRR